MSRELTFENPPDLIIFDFDGVLVDSEIIGHKINAIEMTQMGFDLTVEKSIELFTGITKDRFDIIMQREFGRTMSDKELTPMLQKIDEKIAVGLKPTLGMPQLLEYLEQKCIKICIASNSSKDYIAKMLKTVQLDNYFKPEYVFNSAMVNYKSKPAPDVFLFAAQHLKTNPVNCLVIEDSDLGIEAANAANMPVIGFLGGLHAKSPWYRDHLLKAGPSIIVESASELLEIMKNVYS